MNFNNIIKRTWKEGRMINIEDLSGVAFQAESGGHSFWIYGEDENGEPIELSGTPAGVMLRADNQDVALNCSVVDGVVIATLPQNAYSVPGRFGITVYLTGEWSKTAIYAAVGTVTRTSSGTIAPPAGADVVTLVNSIATAVAAIPVGYNASFAPAYSASSVYAVGQYVTYNGTLYRCTTAITSGETWNADHWTAATLGNDVSDLKSAINYADGRQLILYIKDYFVDTHGDTVNLTPTYTANGFACAIVDCQAGDKFTITGEGGSNARLWAFVDSSTPANRLSASGSGDSRSNFTITAPTGAAKLVLNAKTSASYGAVLGTPVYADINNVKADLAGTRENALDFSYSVSDDLYVLEKTLLKKVLDIRPDFRYGIFESSGYVFGDKTKLTTQVFEPGMYTIIAPTGTQYEIYTYNSDNSGTQKFTYRTSLTDEIFTSPFVITFRHSTDPNTTVFSQQDVMDLRNGMTLKFNNSENGNNFIYGLSNDVIAEFYLIDTTYTPYGVRANSSSYRMKLKNSGGTIITDGQDVHAEFYSDKIQRFIDPSTCEIVAYYILHYTGTNYSVDSNSLSFRNIAKTLDKNPIIAEYLNRTENLVLIGDSIFGYHTQNPLEALMATASSKKVFNCAFGGCQMAWRTADGSNSYDPFSFVSVMDAICETSPDYASQIANKNLNEGYPYRIANLKNIDWSKPTTVFVNYVNNDITADVPIGEMWDYQNVLTDYNKQTVIGAFNYGLQKLLTKYPNVKVVQFTSAYRRLGANSLPPYAYENGINKKPSDYDEAIKENANRIGISVFDFHKCAGRNWYNKDYYQQDGSHYNDYGFGILTKVLNALDEGFID